MDLGMALGSPRKQTSVVREGFSRLTELIPSDELGSWAALKDLTPSSDLHDLTDTEQTFRKILYLDVKGCTL